MSDTDIKNLKSHLENLDDGGFGPVEFKAYIEQDEDGEHYVFISHLRVHDEYQGRGHGTETIQKVAQIVDDSPVDAGTVCIDIGGGDRSEMFLRNLGFEIERRHENQVSAVATVRSILQS